MPGSQGLPFRRALLEWNDEVSMKGSVRNTSAEGEAMSAWSLVYEGFDPAREKLREALCTVGNGYFATRGAAPEARADGSHYPGTYLAGGYNRLKSELAEREVENEDLVNLPNWLPLTFRIGEGDWFDPEKVEVLLYRQELDMRCGVLRREVRFRDREGRTTRLRQTRLVHMSLRHLAAMETVLTAEDWSAEVELCSTLDGSVENAGVERYRKLAGRHLETLETAAPDAESLFLRVRTVQSRLEVAVSERLRLFRGEERLMKKRRTRQEKDAISQLCTIELRQGKELRLEKIVALHTSRDQAISECGVAAKTGAARAGSFRELFETHSLAWKHLWQRFDGELEFGNKGDGDSAMRILRLHIFHLLQTVSLHTMDLDVGVPARGWHGEAYRGHIFWDELFIFPLLNLRIPEVTRTLLQYRYRRLGEARAAAAAEGLRGAMFPWQSGSDGREESQRVHLNPKSDRWIPDLTHLQRHVNAAIAYNIWQYFQVTRDLEFLSFYGAEMFFEIARFWASLATWSEEKRRYEILGIMGPDEYHDAYPGAENPGLDNNAYTNVLAVWVLCRGLEMLEILPDDRRQELVEELVLSPEELQKWDEVSRRMCLVFHGDGIISQFEGYADLEDFDWETYRRRFGPIMRLDRILEAEGDDPNRYKISKQADVLMLFYLFSAEELQELFDRLEYPFVHETIPKNIEYYIERTSHGSTLSHIVHAWVLARSDRARSWKLFTEALGSDVADVQGGTTPEGIHLGAMAGTVDLIQRGSTDIDSRGDVLWFNPCLPEELIRLRLHIRYRGQPLEVDITSHRLRITALRCRARSVMIGFRGEVRELKECATLEFAL
jgi:alpha,alpha-trehalase